MTKLNYDIVKERFNNKGLKLLSQKYVNNHRLMDCEDNDGYRFNISINHLDQFTKRKMVYTKNKWSLYNINKYIENNKITSQLLSKQYKGSKVPLTFRCECGQTFRKSWDDFYMREYTLCPNCMKKQASKKKDIEVVDNEFRRYGYQIIDKSEYTGNNIPIECLTTDGYKVMKSYSNLKKNGRRNIFSYAHNKDNYVYNVNHYAKINEIDITCLQLLDYRSGAHGQYYIMVQCACGNIYKSTIDYIRYGNYRCPICSKKMSNSEYEIKKFLDSNNIKNISQHKFGDCKYKRELPFDFYLPEYNTCVEFDGVYHFKQQPCVTEEQFKEQILRDKIKNKFCDDNNIKLIRIPYFNFNRKQLRKIIIDELPPMINDHWKM